MTSIETKLGPVAGTDHDGIGVFLGIPYAAAPVGNLRWQPPQPAEPWPNGLDATKYPNRCHQPPYPEALLGRDIPGDEDEDCLYLNIYTPAADEKARPVMFWIHGGAFMQGSANEYDGTTLADDNDVVVVAINYRLGIFGFFDLSSFGSEFAGTANLGLQDQIAALKWVRDNIADYGGDPNNITIFGESAGGSSVLALLSAPAADGLFHKAIAFSPGELIGPPQDNVSALSLRLGLSGDELFNRLKQLPATELFALQLEGTFGTNASVDGTVVSEQPSRAIRNKGTAGIPLISGCCKDEGTFLAPAVDLVPGALETFGAVLAMIVGNGDPTPYLQYLDELLPDADALTRMERIWYDFFRASALRSAEASTAAGAGGWMYNFDAPTDNPLGVTHASEIAFTFNSFKRGDVAIAFHDGNDPFNKELAENWSRTFATFARTGDPNGAGLPQWPKYDAQTRACLVINKPPRIDHDPDGPELREKYGMG